MRKNIQTGSSGGINMTPMIDVVFQMIIFFVCTAQLEQEQFSKFIKLADSPNAPAVAEAKDPRTITIEVDGKGKSRSKRAVPRASPPIAFEFTIEKDQEEGVAFLLLREAVLGGGARCRSASVGDLSAGGAA